MVSPFDILRIDPDADEDAVDRAYRRRAMETHPDQGGSASEFRIVREAYEEITAESTSQVQPDDLEESDDAPREDVFEVEYLNYEALDDHGWALEDEDLFEKAADERLADADYGRVPVHPGESLLEAAEESGYAWPYACRGGACANCAVAVVEGEVTTPVDHILPPEMIERGIRLSCVGAPITADAKVVYNVKHLPDLDDLRLPPRPFEGAHSD